ncbi:MAG: helix-turn-helix transcriptional regulator, partial [Solirubrobacteraceae bacterium]
MREDARDARHHPPEMGGLLTAAEVAARFGVSRGWVYGNADALGALRLGDGPKPRVRFDAQEVAERLRARSIGEESRGGEVPARARLRAAAAAGVAPDGLEVL